MKSFSQGDHLFLLKISTLMLVLGLSIAVKKTRMEEKAPLADQQPAKELVSLPALGK